MNLSVDIVVKIHPAESIRDYKLTLADSLKNVKILKKGSLRKIINGADIVISAASGALFDACILGKKVICFLAAREEIVKKSDTIFKKIKEVKTVFNKDELRQALLIFLNEKELLMELDEANRNSFKEYIGVIDGGASVRALDAIESVMYEQ
jgi:spore coat polysaccharide biosynthesis predicted glycosyltransferase SpsG